MPDKKKNVIDVIKDGKDTIFPSQDQARRPGVIHLTSRTRRPRCDISTNIVMYLQILSISRCHMQWTKMPPCEYLCGRRKAKARDRQPERKAEKKPSPRTERQQKWLVTTSYHSSQQNKETELTTVDSQNELNMFQFKTLK